LHDIENKTCYAYRYIKEENRRILHEQVKHCLIAPTALAVVKSTTLLL